MLDSIFGSKEQRDYNAPSPITGTVPPAAAAGPDIRSKAVLIITGNDAEDLEFFYPYYRLVEEGVRVDVATPDGGELKCKHGEKLSQTLSVDKIDISAYAMLYLPGGKAPASLRKDQGVMALVERFVASGKPIAAICHGPQLLVSANAVRGKRLAAWPEVGKEITDAGGIYVNEATVRDGQFITARWPGDLPSHMRAVMAVLRSGQVSTASATAA